MEVRTSRTAVLKWAAAQAQVFRRACITPLNLSNSLSGNKTLAAMQKQALPHSKHILLASLQGAHCWVGSVARQRSYVSKPHTCTKVCVKLEQLQPEMCQHVFFFLSLQDKQKTKKKNTIFQARMKMKTERNRINFVSVFGLSGKFRYFRSHFNFYTARWEIAHWQKIVFRDNGTLSFGRLDAQAASTLPPSVSIGALLSSPRNHCAHLAMMQTSLFYLLMYLFTYLFIHQFLAVIPLSGCICRGWNCWPIATSSHSNSFKIKLEFLSVPRDKEF